MCFLIGGPALLEKIPQATSPAEAGSPGSTGPAKPPLHWWQATVVIVLVGLLWRLGRYCLHFPIWGDEVMVALNLPGRSYLDLTGHLDHCQIAPILWLWAQKCAYVVAGHGEPALRFFPLVAGVLAMLGQTWLAWRLMPGRAAFFATALLAVAIWPVSMSTLAKHYSFDLLFAVVLLLPAQAVLTSVRPWRPMLLLACVIPVALLGSFSCLFVAGAANLVGFHSAWRGSWRERLAFVLVALVTLFTAALVLWIGQNQLASATGSWGLDTREGMDRYWAKGFPPDSLLLWPWWLLMGLTGQMVAYPLGAERGGSILTAAMVAMGAWALVRTGRWRLALLLLAPIALNLAAGCLRRYPFGVSCRLAQALAPGICLLAGLGIDAFLTGCKPALQRRLGIGLGVGLVLVGLGGLVRDMVMPYRDPVYVWRRQTLAEVIQITGDDLVVIEQWTESMDCVFLWGLLHRVAPVHWMKTAPDRLEPVDRVWVFCQENADTSQAGLMADRPGWREVESRRFDYLPAKPDKMGNLRCTLRLFENGGP